MPRFSALSLFSLLLVACGSSNESTPPGNDASDDAYEAGPDTLPDSAPPDTIPDAPETAPSVEKIGARIWGTILAMRRTDRFLWIGTSTVPDPNGGKMRGGLYRLSIDTGAVKVFESELPQRDFESGKGPIPTSVVVAHHDGFLAVEPEGLLEISKTDAVTEHAIAGATVYAVASDTSGGRDVVWVGTSGGLQRRNGATLELEKTIDVGARNVTALAVDPKTGAVYAVAADDGAPAKAVRVLGDEVKALPSPPKGTAADVVFSAKHEAAYVSYASWDVTGGGIVRWDGTTATALATERELSRAARGESFAFGTWDLAVDDDDDLLVVGGRMRPKPFGALMGGGVVFMSLAVPDGTIALTGATQDAGLGGDHVRALSYDPTTRRTYVSSMEPCSDVKLAGTGLLAISFTNEGRLRLERPILSGVRAVAFDGLATWVGLRDDGRGLACDGYSVQAGFVKLLSNGAGEMPALGAPKVYRAVRTGLDAIDVLPGGVVALAGGKEDFLHGPIGSPEMVNPAATWEVSLWVRDVKWIDASTLILGGRATHDEFGEEVDDVSTRGAVLVGDSNYFRFVRKANKPTDVEGLLTSDISSILVDADGSALLACATERTRMGTADRIRGTVFVSSTGPRKGGIVRIKKDRTIEIVAGSDVAPDPEAIAFAADHTLWVLDAEKGLLHQKGTTFESVALGTDVAGAWPHGLWIGDHGERVATFDRGALVTLGGTTFVKNVGHAWRAVGREDGVVFVGTDDGLLRAKRSGVATPTEAAPATGALPAMKVVDPVTPK